jgi:RND family efflux transporter MFP subunit
MNFVDNEVNPNSGTIRGRAVFDNPNNFLTPGLFGRLRLLGTGEYEAMLIPDKAILSDQSRKIVMTVADDGSVNPKVIVPGPLIDGLRVIRSGLETGDRIIINGLLRARPGSKVTPELIVINPQDGSESPAPAVTQTN